MGINIVNFHSCYETIRVAGLNFCAFNPNILTPGDGTYNPRTREHLRDTFSKSSCSQLSKIPPIIVRSYRDMLYVFDGNHRAEAAFFTQKPVLGIYIETERDFEACFSYNEGIKSPHIQGAFELLIDEKNQNTHRRCQSLQSMDNIIEERLENFGLFYDFYEYAFRAQKRRRPGPILPFG
jgi:hypothetical protein